MPTNLRKPTLWQRIRHNTALMIALLVLLAFAIWGIFSRIHAEHGLKGRTEEQATPSVIVIPAPHGPEQEEVVLPGTVTAWHEAPIYARTSGYVKKWYTGMGTPVKQGDLLAEIETPEINAQMHQAEADVATAEANSQLAQSTAERWQALLKTNAVSKQEADEKSGDAKAKTALVAAAHANLDRLRELVSFQKVTAPFDGVITSRTTDIGALINAGNNNGQVMFRIADSTKLRIYVQVPQLYSAMIAPNLKADLYFAERPGKVYPVTLYHTADALEPTARTLLIEFIYDNSKGELLPGGYTDVHIKLPALGNNVRLPVEALIFRSDGLQVATIDPDGKALLKPIKTGRDFGKQVEVISGIEPEEKVILNPPDSLVSGQKLRVVTREQAAAESKDKNEKDNKDKGVKESSESKKPIQKTKDGGLTNSGNKGDKQP